MIMPELLRAIEEDFDNVAHWHPLADWLQERNDPRGELIAIDIALETETRPELQARRAEILEEHAPKLLGETFSRVIAEKYGSVVWRRGFVDEVKYVGNRSLPHRRAVGWLVKLMIDAESHEPFTLLRSLDFSYTDFDQVDVLAKFPHLKKVKVTGAPAANDKAIKRYSPKGI